MKIILLALSFVCSLGISYGQASSPFTGCPGVPLAITRPGTNAYNNDPVTFYTLNTATGATVPFVGDPLKDPTNTANNMDINGVGYNAINRLLYGMNPTATTTPKLYKMGSDYSAEEVGVLRVPAPVSPNNLGIVNSAEGELDNAGNCYFTALTGVFSPFPFTNPTFTPGDLYRQAFKCCWIASRHRKFSTYLHKN